MDNPEHMNKALAVLLVGAIVVAVIWYVKNHSKEVPSEPSPRPSHSISAR